MKKLSVLILVGLLAALNASAELKVAVIDMEKIFDGYKKVASIETQMKKEIEQTANQLDSKRQEGINLLKKFEELRQKEKNAALSADARNSAKKEADRIQDILEKKREAFEKSSLEARKSLATKEQAQRKAVYEEVRRTAIAVANKQGAGLILDKSARGTAGFPAVVYSQDAIDITASTLNILNAGK